MIHRLPDFLIIGAVKSATSWMNEQLRRSDKVCLPAGEPHFFTREFHRGTGWYADLFAASRPGQIVGEKSADYLVDAAAPARAAGLLPDVRLIVQLREPVQRAYSDYCMLFRRGEVSGDIASYLDPRRSELRRFLDNGLYARAVRRWLDAFEREQLLILLFDEVAADGKGALSSVAGHIGLPTSHLPPPSADRVKDSRASPLPLPLRKVLAPAKELAKPLRGTRWFEAARSTLARPLAYPPLPAEIAARLYDFYAPEVTDLERMIGRDLSAWRTSKRDAA
jgi:hypothetical protein